jgi:hypothetical protein
MWFFVAASITPLAGTRTDADPNPHKITNSEPILGHVRSINPG